MPTSASPPTRNEDDINDEPDEDALSPTASDQEIKEYERRKQTLAARRKRRFELRQRQILEDELSALRMQVAHMRVAHSDFGLPPLPTPKPRKPRNALAYLAPMPAITATAEGDPIQLKRQNSMQACWRSRKRKMQERLEAEDEVAGLKAEMAELRRQMSAFVFRARL
jgi:hypothetical protein